jgi:hypothetical protein
MHMTPFVAESIAGLRAFAADLATARRRTDEALRTTAPTRASSSARRSAS